MNPIQMKHAIPRGWAALRLGAAALTAICLPAQAGTYFTDFSTDPTDPSLPASQRLTLFSNQAPGSANYPGWVPTGGNPSDSDPTGGGYLKLTDAVNTLRSTIVFPDFEPGFSVAGFKFGVDARIGGGTSTPADGFSINFARSTDPVIINGTPYAGSNEDGLPQFTAGHTEADRHEEGTRTGLGIGFDAHFSGTAGESGDRIGISVRVDNVIIHQFEAPVLNGSVTNHLSLQTGPLVGGTPEERIDALGWARFEVELDPATGNLDVWWKGEHVIQDLPTGFFPGPGRLVFGSRTGGLNQAHHFDNLSLETFPVEQAALTKAEYRNGEYRLEISDFGTASVVTPADISIVEIGPEAPDVGDLTITKDGGITTIVFQPAEIPTAGSQVSYYVAFEDQNEEPLIAQGLIAIPHLPQASLIADEPTLNLWNIREIRGAATGANLGTAVAIALNPPVQTDPPDPNIRIENYTAPYFNISDDVDFGSRGFFKGDAFYATNTAGSNDDNIVGLGKTKIQVDETGTYTFWVQSDDGFALRINGAEFQSVAGTAGALIDPADASTIAFLGGTGNSNTRASIVLEAGVEYVVDFVWFEGGGGSFAEVAWASGNHVFTTADGVWNLVGGAGQTQIFPEGPLPGTTATSTSEWAITDYRGAAYGGTLRGAIEQVVTPGNQGATATQYTSPVINYVDPDNAGTPGYFNNNLPYPSDTVGVNDDNFITVGKIQFDAAAGDYTFAMTTDDGFAFRILGGAHVINNAGPYPMTVDPLDGTAIYNPNWNAAATFAVYRFPAAGTYTIEIVSNEGGGGASMEVLWAAGNHTNFGSTSSWALVGNPNDPSVPPLVPAFAANIFGGLPPAPDGYWSVRFFYPTSGISNLNQGIAAALNPDTPSHTGVYEYLNFRNFVADGQVEGTWGSGLFWSGNTNVTYQIPPERQFLGASGLVDNVAALATARIVIPSDGNYTFGINSDDGFMLRILGAPQGFTRVSGAATIDPAQPNTIYRLTGSNNARGVINLTAGSYDVEFAYYEGGGNAHFEVYAAPGNFTNDGDTTAWRIVGHTPSGGLSLQAQPSVGGPGIGIGEFMFDAGTGDFSFSWSSDASATYTIQYSTDLENWMPLEASYPGQAGTTTYNGNASTLAPAGPKEKVFFRLREN